MLRNQYFLYQIDIVSLTFSSANAHRGRGCGSQDAAVRGDKTFTAILRKEVVFLLLLAVRDN